MERKDATPASGHCGLFECCRWIVIAFLCATEFPVSTIDSDGAHAGRYDVRKTLVWLDDENPNNLNSYFFLFWLTTVDGRKYHNLTSPRGSDNYTGLNISTNYAGVQLNVHVTPTGNNLYIGGGGGITLLSDGNDFGESYLGTPGYSRGYFERQWGEFGISGGHYGYWLYLSNGLMVHKWVVGPTVEHPNGVHEVVEVGRNTTAFNVNLDIPSRQARLDINQLIRESELRPLPGANGYNISEAYAQGEGVWEGELVKFYGHLEQLSFW
ncbi:hypothetical protein N7522_002015 [Penicillium canescens]|uniref:Uncharacterized protein n=1 Tax=Penicillium canescens TaxID=5083 RepID=A0AAD6I599_PENCN|nr:uncharacterized protein N7446_014016 [Penicillium canescens]KAJ6018551.1 hypothetical protein N7522_002015 [Penicillium canescens]KAJ6034157.1 hypothetical protein N7460_009974 [Penicillium canescens]KAJ6039268.1 hypothetical protein N7446_014016 [Penicillium canescens]KAJ6066117.1 hypothetical protein N7444_000246 [Penicillium canescens]KAJ6174721.1 hypothetical protein N7485_005165 [Penicillium canescens]